MAELTNKQRGELRRQQIRDLLAKGHTPAQIREVIGMSRQQWHQYKLAIAAEDARKSERKSA